MVEFGKGYAHLMDREYSQYGHSHDRAGAGTESTSPLGSTNDVGVRIGDLGMSMGLGPVPNVQAIAAKIRPGTKKIEFGFMGMQKGSAQQQTPGMYGLKQRQALVEIGKANRVDFTTHSSVGVYGLAGMDQQGNFSKQTKEIYLQEVKRAIDFAADVGRGGPVVVHTGEFSRSIADAEWNLKEDSWKKKFQQYEREEERTSYRVIDQRTGQLIQEARKNRKIAKPVWKRYEDGDDYWRIEEGKEYVDNNKQMVKPGDYIDYFGNKVDMANRVPVFDSEAGHFKTRQMGWQELEQEARELTSRARKYWEENKDKPKEVWEKDLWLRFKDIKSKDEIVVRPEEAYIIATLETNAAHSRGWALQYGGTFDEEVEAVKKLKKAKEFYQKVEGAISEEEKWKLKRQARELLGGLIPEEAKLPTELIDRELKHLKHRMEQSREAASSQWVQAEEAMETIRHVQSAETYAQKEAYDSYARLGIDAMRKTSRLKEQGKLKRPITIAMENLFPEQYGSHPDEIVSLIKGSRERMQNLLVQQGLSEQQAAEKAKQHLVMTFDTGHLNMWRKYWKGDPKKSMEENEKEFDKWMIKKVEEMVPYIGHVHLVDNYGYHDDHLAPGEGNTPVRDMVKLLKEKGYKGDLIVEPGADYTTDVTGFHTMMKTWRNFGIPVYGSGSGLGAQRRTWSDVGYGFFGQNQPPYFTFGAYSPSEDWTLWSGVALE